MAKQQQYHSEKQLNYKIQQAELKRKPNPSNHHQGGGVLGGGSFALSAPSVSVSGRGGGEGGGGSGVVDGSQKLQNAGALVLHQSGRSPPPNQQQQQQSRKLL